MSEVMETAEEIHAGANRLYWHSTDSVEALAKRLGMSRHALYASVRPAPAGIDCSRCGGALVFPNRSSRSFGKASCTRCATVEAVPAPGAASDAEALPPLPLAYRRPTRLLDRERLRRIRNDLAAVGRERVRMIGSAALLGAVVGYAAVGLARS